MTRIRSTSSVRCGATTAGTRRSAISRSKRKRILTAQQWIDEGGDGDRGRTVTANFIREIHRRFCELLPDDLLWAEDPTTYERVKVIPGALRERDVAVGDHIAISAPAVLRFLQRFDEVYSRLGKTETILAAACGTSPVGVDSPVR